MNINQLLDGVEYGPTPDKLAYLQELNDCVEFKTLTLEEVNYAANFLINNVLYETDKDLTKEIFRVLENIFLTHSSLDVSIEPLLVEMENNESLLANTLVLIPFTSKPAYIPLIEKYQNHSNELIRKNAAYALRYLKK